MYLINAVYSDGLDGGRHAIPFVGSDEYVVTVEAYESYKAEFDFAVMEGDIESPVVDFEEFYNTMKRGFNGESDLVLIQRSGFHIQYEGSWHEVYRQDNSYAK